MTLIPGEKRSVIFILDGAPAFQESAERDAPNVSSCSISSRTAEGVKQCYEPSAGTYEVLDADTNEYLATVQLCKEHGEKLATGGGA